MFADTAHPDSQPDDDASFKRPVISLTRINKAQQKKDKQLERLKQQQAQQDPEEDIMAKFMEEAPNNQE